MSVWLFMFSCQSPSLWAMLNPQFTLTLFKCSMRKKKGSCPSAHLRSVQCFLLFMSTSPSSPHNFLMASEIWLPFQVQLIWPFQVQLFVSIGQGLFQALPPTRSYTRKAVCSNPLWRMTDQMDPCLVESVAKEE